MTKILYVEGYELSFRSHSLAWAWEPSRFINIARVKI